MGVGGLRHWWYGDFAAPEAGMGVSARIGGAVVSIDAIQDVVQCIVSALEGYGKERGISEQVEVRFMLPSGAASDVAGMAAITPSDWRGAHIEIQLASAQGAEPQTSIQLSLTINESYSRLSGYSASPDGENVVSRLHAQCLEVLAHDAKRLPRPSRPPVLRAAATMVGLALLCMWALLDSSPPLPVWILTIVGFGAVCWLTAGRVAAHVDPLDEYRFMIRVDPTPRREVLAKRANNRADLKQRMITAFVVSPISIFIGAMLKGLVG